MKDEKPSNDVESKQKNLGLWITVASEGLMIIAVAIYSMYEIRRTRELLHAKIERVSEFSARQGEKVDRMVTALELYIGTEFNVGTTNTPGNPVTERKIDEAI